ncbi:hypothetical protein MTO96_047665 [Rhipicephalus appendiculatus]
MKALVMIVVVLAVCAAVVSSFSFSSTDCPAQAVPGVTLKVPDPNDCSKYSLCMQLFNMKLDCSLGTALQRRRWQMPARSYCRM